MIYAFGARNTAVLNELIIMILRTDKFTLKTTVIQEHCLAAHTDIYYTLHLRILTTQSTFAQDE